MICWVQTPMRHAKPKETSKFYPRHTTAIRNINVHRPIGPDSDRPNPLTFAEPSTIADRHILYTSDLGKGARSRLRPQYFFTPPLQLWIEAFSNTRLRSQIAPLDLVQLELWVCCSL